MRYANDTSVSVGRSRAEIEEILTRYGADRFGYIQGSDAAQVMFLFHGWAVRFTVPLPSKDEFRTTPGGRRRRSEADTAKAWEQACRQRWRALALAIKAKLEAVECGITTFEEEFLAHLVLPTGETMGQYALPRLEQVRRGEGDVPKLTFA